MAYKVEKCKKAGRPHWHCNTDGCHITYHAAMTCKAHGSNPTRAD